MNDKDNKTLQSTTVAVIDHQNAKYIKIMDIVAFLKRKLIPLAVQQRKPTFLTCGIELYCCWGDVTAAIGVLKTPVRTDVRVQLPPSAP